MKNQTKIRQKGLFTTACSFALAGVLALTGCSSASTSSTDDITDDSSSTSEVVEEIELQIFAANSLSKALEEVQELYTSQNPEITFADTQYEASGTLNEMLGAGAYADILITASSGTMNTAVEEGYVDETTRFDMFTNELVIVAAEDSDIESITLEDLATGAYTLAVGDDNVPAGNYAKQALSTIACWIDSDGTTGSDSDGQEGTFEGTPLEGLVVEGSSVGNVCNYASTGEVDLAIVYTSDVYRIGGVKIVGEIDADTHRNIIYPAAICANSNYSEAAQAFLEWAFTDEDAIAIWQEWGFELAS